MCSAVVLEPERKQRISEEQETVYGMLQRAQFKPVLGEITVQRAPKIEIETKITTEELNISARVSMVGSERKCVSITCRRMAGVGVPRTGTVNRGTSNVRKNVQGNCVRKGAWLRVVLSARPVVNEDAAPVRPKGRVVTTVRSPPNACRWRGSGGAVCRQRKRPRKKG